MARIPFGATESYGALTRRAGSVARAIGGACGANPIPIVIPCHRVVGEGGALGGFSGGAGPRPSARCSNSKVWRRANPISLTRPDAGAWLNERS